jgi:hypothetical protein
MYVSENKIITKYNVALPLEYFPGGDGARTAEIYLTTGKDGSAKPFSDEPALFEFGFAALNAVCSRMFVRVFYNSSFCSHYLFRKGVLSNEPEIIPIKGREHTEIQIVLDASILPNTTFDYSKIVQEASRFIKLTGIPIRVEQIA